MKISVYNENALINEIELSPGKLYTVGRKEDCDVVLEKHPGISREHFEIDEDVNGWRVNVLSEVMLINFNGEEKSKLDLQGSGEFNLGPYRFVFQQEKSISQSAQNEFNNIVEENPSQVSQNFSDIEVFNDENSEGDEPKTPATFDGNDEKTAIHGFNGLPYIKIIGQNGKKSEFFRLEGNLWVVGGDETASVYIKEPAAAQNHFEISKTDKGYFVIDSGSPEGTHLNGQKLTPKKPSRLLSGDILTIGDTSIQFELRDKAFKRKVSNIPLNMYKNPLVFFDQDVAMVSLDDEETGQGSVEELDFKKEDPKNKKTVMIRMALVAVVVLIGVIQFLGESNTEEQKISIGSDPFSQLSPAEQKIVVQTYKLSKQLYLAGNFELALKQLEKLHSIIPVYKDSQEMEEYCINSRELKRQQAMIEQQKREQDELENKVRSFISQCNQQFARSDDIDGVQACLAPAMNLDPNNPAISQLISEVKARQEEKIIRQKMAAEQEDKVRRGRELFTKARLLHRKSSYLEAMEAYENHIHSGLPDPKNLVRKSQRNLAAIERHIKTEKNKLINQAKTRYGNTNLREAIVMARKAQKVDPYDPKISAFIFKAEKELNNKMKSIYMDSVIEERFGNLENSRKKWEEIVSSDIEDGEYYKKASRKLKEYGFKY